MQQGIFLLWVLAVGACLGAWIYLEAALSRHGKVQSRRKVTGYELARQLLDRNQLSRIPITRTPPGKAPSWILDELFLREENYQGSRLSQLAQVLHQTERLLVGSNSTLSLYLRTSGARTFQGIVAASWVLVLVGATFSAARSLGTVGQLLFVLSALLGVATLSEEFEARKRSVSSLASIEGLELDEKVRLKKILDALRWSSLAQLIEAPFSFYPRKPAKRNHALSKSH
jgi:hypothetical protein